MLLDFCVSIHLTFSSHSLMDNSHIGCKQKQGSAEEIRGRHSGPWPLPLASLLPLAPNIMRDPDLRGWMWKKKSMLWKTKGEKKKHRSHNITERMMNVMYRMIKQKETGKELQEVNETEWCVGHGLRPWLL